MSASHNIPHPQSPSAFLAGQHRPRRRSAEQLPGIAFRAALFPKRIVIVAQSKPISHTSGRNHLIPTPRRLRAHPHHRDQIAIAPRQPSAPQLPARSFPGGFRTTAPVQAANRRDGPSSETLHDPDLTTRNATSALPPGLDIALKGGNVSCHV